MIFVKFSESKVTEKILKNNIEIFASKNEKKKKKSLNIKTKIIENK